MEQHRRGHHAVSRRKALAGGLAVGTAAWVTPSIIGLDQVAAAVGSCGASPLRVDWSPLAGTFPTSTTASDGTVVMITALDPLGVTDPTFFGQVYNGTLNGRDNPMLIAMTNANNGDGARIRFNFSQPVQVCFNLVDVDRSSGNWEDTIEITGTNGGTAVNLGAADFVTGATTRFFRPIPSVASARRPAPVAISRSTIRQRSIR